MVDKIGTIVSGAVVLTIGVWFFLMGPTTDVTTKYAGGAVLGVLGLALLITGLKK